MKEKQVPVPYQLPSVLVSIKAKIVLFSRQEKKFVVFMLNFSRKKNRNSTFKRIANFSAKLTFCKTIPLRQKMGNKFCRRLGRLFSQLGSDNN
jgi:hypothetical protein